MKINSKKLDELVHSPVKLATELEQWEERAENLTRELSVHLEKGNKFISKIALYRQELLNNPSNPSNPSDGRVIC